MAKNSYAAALAKDLGGDDEAEAEYSVEEGCLYLPKEFFGAFSPGKGDTVNLSLKVKSVGDTIELEPESFSNYKSPTIPKG